MASAREKVLKETKLLLGQMDDLREEYGGRWVVFRGGKVQSVHDTEDEAYEAAVRKYGLEGGFVVDTVEHKEPVPITAGVLFGL